MTMKKSIFISLCMVMAATAVLTSCKKDNDTVSFRATISTYQNNGKVYIDNNRYANWIDGDKVLINGATYTVGVEGSGNNRIASINGVAVATSDQDGYYAIYPSECALTTPTSGFPQILLPQVQLYRSTTIDGQTVQIVEAPMAAYCSADREQAGLDFTNLCSLLKVELDEPMEVGYITVSSSNTPLWGKATISGTNNPVLGSPERATLYSNDNTVTLDCTALGLHHEGSGASSGVTSAGPFYIVLPPATNVADLTVSIYVFTGSNSNENRRTITKYTKSATSSITIESNKIYGIGDGLDDFEEENVPDVPFPKLGSGEFSVAGTGIGTTNYSSTKKVRFALGNLQYNAATNTWRIAENQWDHLGTANRNIGEQYTGWIDLFGYGTSGYTYMPWRATSGNDAYNLYAQGNITNTNHDWGVNPISNGGNQPEKWRTLTQAELYHLFNDRGGRVRVGGLLFPNYVSVAEQLHHTGVSVHGVSGMIVLPDNFPWNTAPYNEDDYWDNITNDKWTDLEGRGAVFFPVTGRRTGTSVSGSNTDGYYWTSTCNTSYNTRTPYALYFGSSGETTDQSWNNYYGHAVRLVRDVN